MSEEQKSTVKELNQAYDKPHYFHIVVTNPDTKEVIVDTVTDIAIIGAVVRDLKQGDQVPTILLHVGNSYQLGMLLGLVNQKVVGFLKSMFKHEDQPSKQEVNVEKKIDPSAN